MKTKIFTLFLALAASVGTIFAQTAKIYATVNAAGTTLTLDYTSSPASGAVDYWPADLYPNVTKVVFNSSMTDARPTTTAEWFSNYSKLTTIEHIDYLNTSEVKDMNRMFENCVALKSLDLSTFNTEKVTNMEAMFYGCDVLEELNVRGWNTAEVTKMNSMFSWCKVIKSLDLTSFDTQKVTDMGFMFANCPKLQTIYCNDDWSKNTALKNSANMFQNCEKLVGGNGTKWDNSKVDKTYACPDKEGQLGYFTEVLPKIYTEFVESTGTLTYYYDDKYITRAGIVESYELTNQRVPSRFKTYHDKVTKAVIDPSMKDAQLTSTTQMFDGDGPGAYDGEYSLTNLASIEGLENLNTSNVTDMYGMFENCYALQLEYDALSKFNTQNVTAMSGMFRECRALRGIDISNFDTKNVTSMNMMFQHCESLTALDLRNFDVQKITSFSYMFSGCKALKTIYCNDDWSVKATKSGKSSYLVFEGCNALQGGNGTKLDNNIVNVTYARPDKPGQMGYFTALGAAIENVNQPSEIKNQKLIINGQLFIQRGEEVFNAQGARVK